MFATLFAAVLLTAGPVKPSAEGKKLIGAWYDGDTQYVDLKADGTGRLGMQTIQWSVETKGALHVISPEDGTEKDLPYELLKGTTLRFKSAANGDLDLTRKKAKKELKAPKPGDEEDKKAKDKKPKAPAPKKAAP